MHYRLALARTTVSRSLSALAVAVAFVGAAPSASATPVAALTSEYPGISHVATDLALHADPMGGLHLVTRTTLRVQVSAQPEDSFHAYRVAKLFQHSGVAYLLAPHLAGRFESLETGPSYMESFVGHLLAEGHEVWGFDNRGTTLSEADCAKPEVQALVQTWGIDSLVADASLVRDLVQLTWPWQAKKVILGGQSLGAITTLATINADPSRYDGFFANEGTLYAASPGVSGDNQDLDGDTFEDNPGLADQWFGFVSSVMIPTLGTCDLTTETLMKVVVPLAFSPAGLDLPRPELDLDGDPFNDGGEPMLDAIDAAFVALRGTPMNLREFVVFAFSVPGPNPNMPGIPGYTLLASEILDLGTTPFGDLSDLGDLADPAKYTFTFADVDRVVADAEVFGNLASRGLLAEMQGALGSLATNPLTGTDHAANLGSFTGHAVFLAGERGFGSALVDTSALMTGAASLATQVYAGYGHGDIRFSQNYAADMMAPVLALGEAVK